MVVSPCHHAPNLMQGPEGKEGRLSGTPAMQAGPDTQGTRSSLERGPPTPQPLPGASLKPEPPNRSWQGLLFRVESAGCCSNL